ncbi:MAG: HutD family protein, partial [Dongiaceae bacterium]
AGMADEFAWRAALAEIEKDGPFSLYGQGIERIITLLDGHGFDLEFTDEEPGLAIREPHMPARFRGDRPSTCRLQNGRCIVFNVLYDEQYYSAQFHIIRPLPDQPLIFGPPGRTTLLFCLVGLLDIKAGESDHHLKPWDSLRIDLDASETPLLTLTARAPDSRLLLVGFEPAVPAEPDTGKPLAVPV